jgi:hypothetical protein
VIPEDGSKIQSPKPYDLNKEQEGVLKRRRTVDNVQKHSGYVNIP